MGSLKEVLRFTNLLTLKVKIIFYKKKEEKIEDLLKKVNVGDAMLRFPVSDAFVVIAMFGLCGMQDVQIQLTAMIAT